MADAVEAANFDVASMAEAHEEHAGMGTTLTVLAVDPETGAFVIGHVGDSRAYRLRSAVLEQLTRDHTVAQDLLDAGQLTNPDISQHPFRHLLNRAVGTESEVEAEIIKGSAEPGDLYLLCTDGLVGVLDDGTLAATLVGAALAFTLMHYKLISRGVSDPWAPLLWIAVAMGFLQWMVAVSALNSTIRCTAA